MNIWSISLFSIGASRADANHPDRAPDWFCCGNALGPCRLANRHERLHHFGGEGDARESQVQISPRPEISSGRLSASSSA